MSPNPEPLRNASGKHPGTLSKSKIVAFRQCPKRLWLEVHHPELREDSDSTKARFEIGHQVGAVARRIYDPKGKGTLVDFQIEGFEGAFAHTAELLKGSRQPIFEAGLTGNGVLAFADVLLPVRRGKAGWRMVEVKSSTSVKDYHRDDIAIQVFAAQAAGVDLRSVAIACLDSSWVYPGGQDYDGLLVETDLTAEAVGRQAEVKQWVAEAHEVVAGGEPRIDMGAHCSDPFECGYCKYCSRGLVQPKFPVEWLPYLSADLREELEEQGVTDLRRVPNHLLNEKQRRVKKHTVARTVYFDAEGAAEDLAPYRLPATFLDFETVQLAVPIWKGTRPYQQIPFQISAHAVSRTGKMTHRGFLDLSGNDPSKAFAEALVDACPGEGPIFAYNATFETSRIGELADRLPRMASSLRKLTARIVDLLPIARNRYYHPSQHGSWSIKAVLPAMVPELSYDRLTGVKDGMEAMGAYFEAIQPSTSAERRKEIEQQLEAYCRLDTLALVRVWQFLSGRRSLTTA